MAVEIREVIIRAEVRQGGATAGGRDGGPSDGAGLAGEERERLVQECVDQVMRILADRRER